MIGITGASGKLGGTILANVQRLRPSGTRVCGFTRFDSDQGAIAHLADEVRSADFGADPAVLEHAFRGIESLLIVSIEGEDDMRVRVHRQAIAAAAAAGVHRIVYTSFFDVDRLSPSIVARTHRLTEDAVVATGCAYTLLRNGPYVDNIAVRIAQAAREDGIFRMATGDARMPFIARQDLALAAAHALLAGDRADRVYRLSGAELLTYQQLCELIGPAVGGKARHVSMTDDEYRAELTADGLSQLLQDRRIAYVQAIREGFMSALTDDFRRLVGRPPTPMAAAVPTLDLSEGQPQH